MNILSAAGLVVGLVLHALRDGVSAAFGGGIGGEEAERPDYPPIVTMVIYSIAILTGGWFIIPKAINAVRRLRPDPNLLMTIATFGAIAINHWFEATSSMYLFSAAGLVETYNMVRARKAIRTLMELAPTTA
jgi:Cd2+/Zn2+-exporting ATPase